jgi:ATP-dependent Lon protease
MLDEIDKLGHDFRGDPAAALLEVLDPEQNHMFSDHYLDLPYDLSKVFFITTANYLDPVPPALEDRMEVIEFPGYMEEDKLEIARRFLIPRQMEAHGLLAHAPSIRFTEGALKMISRNYTYEAGVRNFEREIANICRKIARRVAEEKRFGKTITEEALDRYLGPPRYSNTLVEEKDVVGVATGVAWTQAGGDVMPIEVTLMPGKGGGMLLTGQLGDVMQESAQAALSYTRSQAKKLKITLSQFDKNDIHLHVPEGAIPKDGPSAGVALATALISAFTGRKVRRDVAMTGEITLRGRVLPVGGIKEKVLAARRVGIKTIVLPKKNEKDLVEVPKRALKDLDVVLADMMDEVVKTALRPAPRKPSSKKKTATTKTTTAKSTAATAPPSA